MLERKMRQKLEAWKNSARRKPLVIFGARQTGKTTSVLAFAHEAFQDVAYIDFYRQPQLKAAFQGSLEPAAVLAAVAALLQKDIDWNHTLLFMDEIQACDEALTSLKYFCQDMPDLPVIAAGSMLGVHVARNGSFPVGYVDMLTMHPMDFEEFAWAQGQKAAFDLARASYGQSSFCPVHDQLMETYRNYLLVGGMPEPVQAFCRDGAVSSARDVLENIRTAYVADMAKYADAADAAKILQTWESLPEQLAKESGSTKFQWKKVASGAKAERYGTAVDWLAASGIVSLCTQVTDGISPLKAFENPRSFKVYVADTGLLAAAYQARPSDFDGTDHRSARFRGGMAENYVMQQLVSTETKPYYWGMQSTYEVEFVVQMPSGIVPVEVKSGAPVSSPSALRFADKYGSPEVIRVTAKNFGRSDSVRNVPLYAALLIGEEARSA